MRIGIIGAGKVGFSLGRHFADSGLKLIGYASKSFESARKAAEFTDSAAFSDSAELVRASDLLFITVPDAAIGQVFESLVSLHENGSVDLTGKFLCHCSGSLSAHDAFGDVCRVGAQACSVHPLCAVNDRYTSHEAVAKALFTIEGDPGLIDNVRRLLEAAGNSVVSIDSKYKARYHAACSIALNLMVGLVQESIDQLIECGFSEEQALTALG
ncbi:MAG: DUF2520 domain-containing protein, partial [Actinobacteria bacterium]|nr:DUF2520 domain-containing protein [Actinomycetota bacterium]